MHDTVYRSHVAGVDGLRAIAVLTVVFYHLHHHIIPGGFLGVDVFFVISGYVITKSLYSYTSDRPLPFLVKFYRKRILRIVPALALCLVVSSLASSMFIPDAWLSEHNKWTAVWAYLGASNLYLVSVTDGYFAARTNFNPFVHTWSLAVEEQFYLLYPLLFYWMGSVRSGDNSKPHRWFALLFLTAMSLGASVYETSRAHERAFYLLHSRFWELAVGALLYNLQATRPSLQSSIARSRVVPTIACLTLAAGFMFADPSEFPFPWALCAVTGTACAIASITGAETEPGLLGKVMSLPPVVYVGRISYSLYLWHWPIFTLSRWTVGLDGWSTCLAALITTFLAATLSFHFVEVPVRESAKLRLRSNATLIGSGVAGMMFFALMTALLFKFDATLGIQQSVTQNSCTWNPYAWRECPQRRDRQSSDVGIGRRLLVVGDSHAGAYTHMAQIAARRLGAEARVNSVSGCSVASLIEPKDERVCDSVEDQAMAWVRRNARPGDVILLASLRIPRLSDQDGIVANSGSDRRGHVGEANRPYSRAVKMVQELQELGLTVVLDAPKPIFRAPAFRCADWFNRRNPVCAPGFSLSRQYLLEYREPVLKLLEKLVADRGAILWDPFPVLCPTETCSAYAGEEPVFSDGDHLSGYGNSLLVDDFSRRLAAIWSQPPASD